MIDKASKKFLELLIPVKILNQKQYTILGGIAENSATIKALKYGW